MACGDPRQARRARLRSAASVQSGACAYRRGLSVATTHSRRFCGQMSLVRITANCRRARRNVAIPPRRAAAASASKAIFRRTCPVFVPSSIEPKHNPRLWVSVAWVQTQPQRLADGARGPRRPYGCGRSWTAWIGAQPTACYPSFGSARAQFGHAGQNASGGRFKEPWALVAGGAACQGPRPGHRQSPRNSDPQRTLAATCHRPKTRQEARKLSRKAAPARQPQTATARAHGIPCVADISIATGAVRSTGSRW
jgi:hypothetical protein